MKLFLTLFFTFLASAQALDPAHLANHLNLHLWAKGDPWTFPGVHQVFADKHLKKAILVVENVPGKKKARLLDMGAYLIYQFPTGRETFTSMAFINFSKSELSFLEQKKGSFFKSVFLKLAPAPSAQAICQNSSMSSYLPSVAGPFEELGRFYNSDFWESSSSCLMGILEGAYESTAGLGVSLWKGLQKLAVDPGGFWGDRVEQFQVLKNFFLNFEASMQEFASGVSHLPDIAKARLFCAFVGGVGVDALASVFLAGAGIGVLVAKMTDYFKRIGAIGNLMARLSRLGKFDSLPKEFFAKLTTMSEEAAQTLLARMRKFGNSDMDDLAVGLARCSI